MSAETEYAKAARIRLGQRLRNARTLADIPAQKLVDKIREKTDGKHDYTSAAIYAWEKGRNMLPEGLALVMAEILGCSEAEILQDESGIPIQRSSSIVSAAGVGEILPTNTYPTSTKNLSNYPITLEDLDILRDAIRLVGGTIPARTALELLEWRKRNTQKSETDTYVPS